MPVRCACGADVSEWAAHCPQCRSDVRGLPLLAADPADPGEPPVANAAGTVVAWEVPAAEPAPHAGDPARRGRSVGPAGRTAAALAAMLVVGSGVVALTRHQGAGSARAAIPPVGGAPSSGQRRVIGLAPLTGFANLVAYFDAPEPLLVSNAEPVDASLAAVAGAALPGSQPVPAGTGGAAAIGTGVRAGHAVYAGQPSNIVDLGPADGVVPGTGNLLGLTTGSGGPAVLDVLAVIHTAATLQFVSQARLTLPAGDAPVAVLGPSVIAVRDEHNHLVIVRDGRPGASLGDLGAVVGESATRLAWTAADGCSAEGACPLHVTDWGTQRTTTISPPPGSVGYATGGGFSPDGATLAAFAAPAGQPGASLARLQPVTVSLPGGAAVPAGSQVLTRLVQGVPVGVAWWSADGNWLVYSGLLGDVRATGQGGKDIDMGLPASYAFAVL